MANDYNHNISFDLLQNLQRLKRHKQFYYRGFTLKHILIRQCLRYHTTKSKRIIISIEDTQRYNYFNGRLTFTFSSSISIINRSEFIIEY